MEPMKRRDLFAEALALPAADRIELAAELLASAPPPGVLSEEDPHFKDELRRRIDEIESGDAKAVPWETVLASLTKTVTSERAKRAQVARRRGSARRSPAR